MPWCIRKCPYCDFNSHQLKGQLPEQNYVDALIADATNAVKTYGLERLSSIFIGGGTPSLVSAAAYSRLFNALRQLLSFDSDIEITIEVNPGATDQSHLRDYHALGINRVSLGVQSFNNSHLKQLGRIHNADAASQAILAVQEIGFTEYNIDLMYGLPTQTVKQAADDLQQALRFKPSHLSWYQLTLEPNTVFYKHPPVLPDEQTMAGIEQQGQAMLSHHGFHRYEVSAFCHSDHYCRHNLNYWKFGDYLGIGAGSHSKISDKNGVLRFEKPRQPQAYLKQPCCEIRRRWVADDTLAFEYMLMVTRLYQTLVKADFSRQTALPWSVVSLPYEQACARRLMIDLKDTYQVSVLGHQFLNDLQALFLTNN